MSGPTRPQGYGVTMVDGVVTHEEDTFTCSHCGEIIFVKTWPPASDEGGFCRACYKHICVRCDQAGLKCEVLEVKIRRVEQRGAFFKAAGL